MKADGKWMYIDEEGVEQGPFETSMMRAWHGAGYFGDDTKVKQEGETAFVAISERASCAFVGAETQDDVVAPEDEDEDVMEDEGAVESSTKEDEPAKEPEKKKLKWFYLDDANTEQGPWSELQMRVWHDKKFFTLNDTRIRTHEENVYLQLSARDPQPDWTKPLVDMKATAAGAPGAPASAAAGTEGAPAATEAPKPVPGAEPQWLYLDKDGVEQGPWTSAQMRTWYNQNLLPAHIKTRQVDEAASSYEAISARECCFTKPAPPSAQLPPPPLPPPPQPYGYQPAPHGHYPPPQYGAPGGPGGPGGMIRMLPPPPVPGQAYGQSAMFNSHSGRFTKETPDGHFENKGLSTDRGIRMMGNYFDHDKWQAERNAQAAKRKA